MSSKSVISHYKFNCDCCQNSITIEVSSPWDYKPKRCPSCIKLIKGVHSFINKRAMMIDEHVYSNYLIEIVYDTSLVEHHSYCDYREDPLGSRWSHDYSTLTCIYPLVRYFKAKDILWNNTISVHHPILKAYKPNDGICPCKCKGARRTKDDEDEGIKPFYSMPILSAKVFHRVDAIELD